MENNKNSEKTLFRTYAITALILLAVLAAVPPLSDHSWEWKSFQKKYYTLAKKIETENIMIRASNKRESDKIMLNNLHRINECTVCHKMKKLEEDESDNEKEENLLIDQEIQIKQIIVSKDRVDRCTTCHTGVTNPDFVNAPQPYKTHPDYEQHPFEKFGCTVCHAGQGRATSKDAAHGNVPFWEAPVLPLEYIQSSCGKCHFSQDIPGAPDLSEGRLIFNKSGCKKCHKLNGIGGSMGPDLTTEGRYGHREPKWLFDHFKDPKALVPDSTMPNYKFTDKEAKALTMYMLSLTDEKIGGYLASKKIIPDIVTGKSLFLEKGCIGCHSISGKGGNVGPDLSNVSKRRSANWIFRHFKDPKAVSPNSVMPRFGFTDDEAKALTMYVLSLTDGDFVGYVKKIKK